MPNRMYRNAEGRRFQDVTTAAGFGHLQKGHAVSLRRLDGDGDQDLFGRWAAPTRATASPTRCS